METGKETVRGGGLAPSPRTMEIERIQQLAEPAPTKPVYEDAPAAVVATLEAIKAIHFQFYGEMINLFDLIAGTERQGEVLHRKGMKLLHDHLDATTTAVRSILIKGEVPAELSAAVNRVRQSRVEKQEDNRVSTSTGATPDNRA